MNQAVVAARVIRGAKLLDAQVPGWRNSISKETLNLQDSSACILGQALGSDFWSHAASLGLSTEPQTVAHGFTLSARDEDADGKNWSQLTEMWLTYLNDRPMPLKPSVAARLFARK